MEALSAADRVVVVGAGVAGWRLCEGLRQYGFTGSITLVGQEAHPPYDRPPLSKQVMSGAWAPERATLASGDRMAELGVEARLGVRAVGLDAGAPSVSVAGGEVIAGTRVVIATGARARPAHYPSSGPLATVRSLDDALAVRATLDDLDVGSRVAVVGGGFLGAELATSFKERGLEPVVFEAAARALIGPLGDEVSSWLGDIASDFGVEVRTGVRIDDVERDESTWRVRLAGETVVASAAVAAVGSWLDLAWLDGSGLEIDDGVVVNRDLEATATVAAIGDVARVLEVEGERGERREHWQVAIDHADHLARRWAGAPPAPVAPTTYFWSDQYAKKIQVIGRPRRDDPVVRVLGSNAEGRWLALYAREGQVTGAVALSQPRALMLTKRAVDARARLDDVLASAPWAP